MTNLLSSAPSENDATCSKSIDVLGSRVERAHQAVHGLPGVTEGVEAGSGQHPITQQHEDTQTRRWLPLVYRCELIGQAVGQTGSVAVAWARASTGSSRSVASNMAVTTRCLLKRCPVDFLK